jgi:hypothetical protein
MPKQKVGFKSSFESKDWKELANNVLDMLIEWNDWRDVLKDLYQMGYSREQLLELGFDSEAIDELEEGKRERDNEDTAYQAHKDAKGE